MRCRYLNHKHLRHILTRPGSLLGLVTAPSTNALPTRPAPFSRQLSSSRLFSLPATLFFQHRVLAAALQPLARDRITALLRIPERHTDRRDRAMMVRVLPLAVARQGPLVGGEVFGLKQHKFLLPARRQGRVNG